MSSLIEYYERTINRFSIGFILLHALKNGIYTRFQSRSIIRPINNFDRIIVKERVDRLQIYDFK